MQQAIASREQFPLIVQEIIPGRGPTRAAVTVPSRQPSAVPQVQRRSPTQLTLPINCACRPSERCDLAQQAPLYHAVLRWPPPFEAAAYEPGRAGLPPRAFTRSLPRKRLSLPALLSTEYRAHRACAAKCSERGEQAKKCNDWRMAGWAEGCNRRWWQEASFQVERTMLTSKPTDRGT